MTHLFVDPADMTGDTLIITGADYNHIKNVLRMRPGDESRRSGRTGLSAASASSRRRMWSFRSE